MKALAMKAMRSARRALGAVAAAVDNMLGEAFGLVGFGLVTYGVYLMHRPSAFIVGGFCCILVAWSRAE